MELIPGMIFQDTVIELVPAELSDADTPPLNVLCNV